MIHSRGHAAPKPCNLSHHHPGRHVTWNAFDKNLGESVEMRGIVEGHRPDIRYAIAPQRQHHRPPLAANTATTPPTQPTSRKAPLP